MYPVLELWGRSIPTYSLMAIIGLLAAYLLMMLLCRRFGINRENVSYIYLGAILGGVVCAKILYLITAIPYLRTDINTVIRSGDNRLWLVLIATYLSGGFVFYGGMIGAGIGAWAMCRLFHWRLADHLTVLAPAIPLFHAFGRIGCLLTGCCYGIPWSWGYQLNASQYAPHHVTLFPVEALESAAEFLFFLIILVWELRGNLRSWDALVAWAAMYAPLRFVDEFFRGDATRGFLGPFSTSQWISIALMVAVVWYLITHSSRLGLARRRHVRAGSPAGRTTL